MPVLGFAKDNRLRRIGESHPRAKFTDGEIDAMRRLREEGLSCRAIAEKFECGFGYVAEVCRFDARNIIAEVVRPAAKPRTPKEN